MGFSCFMWKGGGRFWLRQQRGVSVYFLLGIMSTGLIGCNTHYAAADSNGYRQSLQFVSSA